MDDLEEEDGEPADEEEEDLPLKEKYKKQMRQIFPQKIELPISTLPLMIKDQIELRPEFQRRDKTFLENLASAISEVQEEHLLSF